MIAITGASGFVGSNLLKVLNTSGYKVSVFGRNNKMQVSSFTKGIISPTTAYGSFFHGIEVVIHIAARVHLMEDSSEDSLGSFRSVNTEGTINFAKQAAQAGVKRFIFLSSIKVNGESTTNRAPFIASDTPKPEDPYGISKAEAEQQLLALGRKNGMEIVIIRPPLVYGEGVKANFFSLMSFVSKGAPLPFRSIKNNKRSLVSVYNLVDLIQLCIRHQNAANQIFLASDDDDLSTAKIVALMAKVQNKKNLALPVPSWCLKLAGKLFNKSDVVDRLTGSLQLDITHTKDTLNWAPPYSVEHGFKLAAKSIQQNN